MIQPSSASPTPPPHPDAADASNRRRRIGGLNRLGLWTLYVREVRRFLKVVLQTVVAPAITTLLFLTIFVVALGRQGRMIEGIHFADFVAPGLIAMAIIQNAFANTSSSILIGKVQGNIIDVIMPPLSAAELVIGFVAGGVTRGLMVGVSVGVAMLLWPGVNIAFAHPLALIYFMLSAAAMLSMAGIITGIWADKFDHSAAITNFVIQPLSLLSGTFYSISRLPDAWQIVSHFNPFFFLIDGIRYGATGISDGNIVLGALVTLAINLLLWAICHRLFASGYKLRA